MKKLALLIIPISFFMICPSLTFASFSTGNDLLKFCNEGLKLVNSDKSYDSFSAGRCLGYITSFKDTYDTAIAYYVFSRKICVDKGVNVNQLLRIVIKYLNEHPEELHYIATSLLIEAFEQAFPCNKE